MLVMPRSSPTAPSSVYGTGIMAYTSSTLAPLEIDLSEVGGSGSCPRNSTGEPQMDARSISAIAAGASAFVAATSGLPAIMVAATQTNIERGRNEKTLGCLDNCSRLPDR